MLKHMLLVLIIGLTFHSKLVDVYGNSVAKPVAIFEEKRAIIPAQSSHTNSKEVQHSDKDEIKTIDDVKQVVQTTPVTTQNKIKVDEVEAKTKAPEKIITSTVAVPHSNDTREHNSSIGTRITKVEHSGALIRSFFVFLGLSVIVMIYLSFRAFRMRPGAPAPTTVRKYGVVGRRSDLEMLPLPLNEEDDDDTLFDVGGQQHR